MNFQDPSSMGTEEIKQPAMLMCQLKSYQLKGLNWLANLYEQGINGILADEMGLGKTVQSIALMAYLAEVHNIWGPFLVIAPASTLHNWQQEITKFVPSFRVRAFLFASVFVILDIDWRNDRLYHIGEIQRTVKFFDNSGTVSNCMDAMHPSMWLSPVINWYVCCLLLWKYVCTTLMTQTGPDGRQLFPACEVAIYGLGRSTGHQELL